MKHRWRPKDRGSPAGGFKDRIFRTFQCKVCDAVVVADVTVGITAERMKTLGVRADCREQIVLTIMER